MQLQAGMVFHENLHSQVYIIDKVDRLGSTECDVEFS